MMFPITDVPVVRRRASRRTRMEWLSVGVAFFAGMVVGMAVALLLGQVLLRMKG